MHTDLDEQYDKIYRYCYMKLRHQQAAEDITQETFLRFLENKTYKDMGKEIGYLYRIAGNLCIDLVRKQKNEELSEEIPDSTQNIQENMAVHMDLRKAIKSLDSQEQELVFLRYVNELSVGKTAEILGISRFALYRKSRECLKKLKKEMEG
ncbi:RNA polymerase sigma factor [Blautia sp. XA-2221]|uniref:RNA polymerase sigma factor n=1 Tax=Blautia sp. XA-2221 TaxID=2903961 RepID=UPI00237876C3|nr:RNA polymerase sigma factor [Blautia sp. XA-2221]